MFCFFRWCHGELSGCASSCQRAFAPPVPSVCSCHFVSYDFPVVISQGCAVLCVVTQSWLILCDLMDPSPPGSFCPWGFSRQAYWSGLPCPPPGDLPNPGIESRSPALQADSLLTEPTGKPMNTGVGSLSFSRGTSWSRNRTGVSCSAGGFFTSWATWEAPKSRLPTIKYPLVWFQFYNCWYDCVTDAFLPYLRGALRTQGPGWPGSPLSCPGLRIR